MKKENKKVGYDAYIAELQAGRNVSFREKGNSMVPLIYSNQKNTYEPVHDKDLKVGDIVWCKVKGNFYTHLLTAIKTEKEITKYQISNNHGYVNGWIKKDKIFGRVIATED